MQANYEADEDAYHRRMENDDYESHPNFDDESYYQNPPDANEHPDSLYYHSHSSNYPTTSGTETRNYGNFTVTTEDNQTPTEFEDERFESPAERYGGYSRHDEQRYDQTESDEYDAEMEDYPPPEPSGPPVGQLYDSEGDYSIPQRRYDSRSASSTTVERRYDSGSEYGLPPGPEVYQYDSSEYPSTVEARYPPPTQPIVDQAYAAQLAALERRYDSYTSDEAGTSMSIFSHDSKNPRNTYMHEEGVTLTTPTPTDDFPAKTNGPITNVYEHYENESYVDPVDIRHPADYEPLSYNSRPPGPQGNRRSSVLTPTQDNSPMKDAKPSNGYLPNGYGNMSENSPVFALMSQPRRPSEEQAKPRNSFDLPQDPHDYVKEYAVYNDIHPSASNEEIKQQQQPQTPITAFR